MERNKSQKNIPQGWTLKRLGDVLDYERPDNYIVKSTSYADDRKIPVLTANKSFILGYTDEDFGIYRNLPCVIFDDFTTDSKFVDFPFKVKSSAIKILKSKDENVDLKFVHERMKLIRFPLGNHKRYYISQYQDIEILIPKSKTEQRKIAEIFWAVDEDIAKTQGVIEATEKLKKGLMQQLFTRGIGHTKFKKTKLGEIPEEWEVIKIKNSSIELIDGDRGSNYPNQKDFSPDGHCLFLNTKNVSKNGFVFKELSFISQKKDSELRKGKLQRGDIILTSRGTVGNVAYYDNEIPFENVRINSGMLIVRHGKQFNPVFLYKYFSSPQMKAKYLIMGSGSAQPQLPVGSFELTEIPLFLIPEQQKIAEIINAIDEKISINKKLKNKLILLKKGLMQDLLSGKVRINN
ncbi:MAG: restriction endonuclease subunit S [Candidatus Moranbacteria bacterium]|nr:restriction endonuclease subunit S [Candidatus Moranbacteria bacterium]